MSDLPLLSRRALVLGLASFAAGCQTVGSPEPDAKTVPAEKKAAARQQGNVDIVALAPVAAAVLRRAGVEREAALLVERDRQHVGAFVEDRLGAVAVMNVPVEDHHAARPAGAPDLTPFGVEPNRRALEILIRYSHEQRLIPRRFSVDELFEDFHRIMG